MSDSISRNELEYILRNLHLCDNTKLNNADKFCKIRPMIKDLNNKFLKHSFNGENTSIDESMIPYFGIHGSRQRINSKPIHVGYKFWVLAEVYGYVIQCESYQVVEVGKQIVSQTRWILGEKVVLDLMECLPQGLSYHVYMDNYFMSFRLFAYLDEPNIHLIGVLNKKKLTKCNINLDK